MAEIVQMPKMSDTMTEGVIAAWHKKVGDTVESGELIAEIETDKATMEYESYHDGVVLHIGAEVGEAIPINGLLAIVGDEGEDISSLLSGSVVAETPQTEAKEESPAPAATESVDVSGINAEIVRMPKMSDTMTTGTIAAWHKSVGDAVESGELMAEIETDKATMEYESYNDGIVLYVGTEVGGSVEVNGVLAIIGEAGADWETLLKSSQSSAPQAEVKEEAPAKAEVKTEAPKAASAPVKKQGKTTPTPSGRIKASPLAKRLADERGINIGLVDGTGPNGRVTKLDVEMYVPAATSAAPTGSVVVGEESYEDVPASNMRKAIAKGLANSQFGAPHFYLTMDIDMDQAMVARKSINEVAPVKISFNDIIVKAIASSLRKHPDVNTYWMADTSSIRKNNHISIGVAMAIEDGLVVPVVKFADNKSLSQISSEVKELAGKAKSKKLKLDEMQGNTFTVSNLGMFGITEFTSIINAPESCILAVGAIKQVPVVKGGEVVPGNIMKVTLTCDHRTVDGAVGASFLATFKGLMEDPVRLLV